MCAINPPRVLLVKNTNNGGSAKLVDFQLLPVPLRICPVKLTILNKQSTGFAYRVAYVGADDLTIEIKGNIGDNGMAHGYTFAMHIFGNNVDCFLV